MCREAVSVQNPRIQSLLGRRRLHQLLPAFSFSFLRDWKGLLRPFVLPSFRPPPAQASPLRVSRAHGRAARWDGRARRNSHHLPSMPPPVALRL